MLFQRAIGLLLPGAVTVLAQNNPPSKRAYVDFTKRNDGDPSRGKELFHSAKTACATCHSIDGTSSKAGPDLSFVGDKFPRRELIRSTLEPSTAIAVGYGTTTVELKSGDEVQGIIKQATDTVVELMTTDGTKVRLPTSRIKEQRGSTVSLMPEGVEAGMSTREFTDLIDYLVGLKQPENVLTGAICHSRIGEAPDAASVFRGAISLSLRLRAQAR